MANAEQPRTPEDEKSPEVEKNPEQIVEKGVVAIDSKYAAELADSSTWGKAKKFFSEGKGARILDGAIVTAAVYTKVTKFGLLLFALEVIKKGGNAGFADGYKIGKDMFSFDPKDKKG